MSFVTEIKTGLKKKLTDAEKKKSSEMIETARKADEKLVTGIFKNLESPGGDVTFSYHAYKGEPYRIFHLWDGKEYELPIGVAKHINRQCKYSRKAYPNILQKESNGDWKQISGKPIERYQFVSTDYM